MNNSQYLHFDIKLSSSKSQLNSLESMDALELLVDKDILLIKLSKDFARRTIMTLFYFKLAYSIDYLDSKYED